MKGCMASLCDPVSSIQRVKIKAKDEAYKRVLLFTPVAMGA